MARPLGIVHVQQQQRDLPPPSLDYRRCSDKTSPASRHPRYLRKAVPQFCQNRVYVGGRDQTVAVDIRGLAGIGRGDQYHTIRPLSGLAQRVFPVGCSRLQADLADPHVDIPCLQITGELLYKRQVHPRVRDEDVRPIARRLDRLKRRFGVFAGNRVDMRSIYCMSCWFTTSLA